MRKSGGEGKHTVFLFSDTQIKDESFVEDINNLLNSGEVPNMFPMDERLQVMEQVRPRASKLGLDTPLELWAFFVSECRNRLHTVLCFSPIGKPRSDALHPVQDFYCLLLCIATPLPFKAPRLPSLRVTVRR